MSKTTLFGKAWALQVGRTVYTIHEGDIMTPCTVTKQGRKDPKPVTVFEGDFRACALFVYAASR